MRALKINVFTRVGFTGFADGAGIGAGITGLAHVLRDFEFNRQAVAIPAGNVGRAFAAQRLILDDDVLEDFIQRRADVDVAIGKRRAVVQDKFFRAGTRRLDFFVKFRGGPFFQTLRLARDEVGLHGEVRARQVQGVFVVHCKIQERKR